MNNKIGSIVSVTNMRGTKTTGKWGGIQSVPIKGKRIQCMMVGGQAIAVRSVKHIKKGKA